MISTVKDSVSKCGAQRNRIDLHVHATLVNRIYSSVGQCADWIRFRLMSESKHM